MYKRLELLILTIMIASQLQAQNNSLESNQANLVPNKIIDISLKIDTLECENNTIFQDCQENNEFNAKNLILLALNENKLEDSKTNDSTLLKKKEARIPENEYLFNGHQRFTPSGKTPYLETNVNTKDILIYGGGLGVLFMAQHIYQIKENWKDKAPFKILEDGVYSLWTDKGTHIFNTYFPSYMFSEGLIAMGLSKNDAVLTGSIMGLAYQTYVEVLDGYGANYGFSPSDYYADIVGATFYFLQNRYGLAEYITPKFAYIPSNWYGDKLRVPHTNFIDDYSSQTTYLSFNMHAILPKSIGNYWPEWLELTVGYSARNLYNTGVFENGKLVENVDPVSTFQREVSPGNSVYGDPKLIIGLDYNLIKLLPDGGAGWNWFKQTLNFLKLPSPAIEIGEKTRFRLLYPFKF